MTLVMDFQTNTHVVLQKLLRFIVKKNYVIPAQGSPGWSLILCTRRLWVRFRSRPLWDSTPASGAMPARPEPSSSMPLLGLLGEVHWDSDQHYYVGPTHTEVICD